MKAICVNQGKTCLQTCNNRKTLNLPQSSVLRRRFRSGNRRILQIHYSTTIRSDFLLPRSPGRERRPFLRCWSIARNLVANFFNFVK